MSWRAALGAGLAAIVAGCGNPPGDLFEVQRSGADPGANLRLLVSDGGSVQCDGRPYTLDPERLIRARRLLRELEPQAELGLELPRGPGSILSYRARMGAGTIAFSDKSEEIPRSFQLLAGFTVDIARNICGIERGVP